LHDKEHLHNNGFMTDSTLWRFLCSVNEIVLLQVSSASECFMTDATLMRFLSSVYEAVLLQGAAVSE
jgi:hypothetical protein